MKPSVVVFMWFALVVFVSGGSLQDVLLEHGLPPGLLPSAVKSFNLDRETGRLEVDLGRPCFAKYDGLVLFNQTVSGNLSYGSLKELVGFTQEELFLWLPVKEVVVTDPSSGVILFDIGVARKQLSLCLFENPPDCSGGGVAPPQAALRMITGGAGARARAALERR